MTERHEGRQWSSSRVRYMLMTSEPKGRRTMHHRTIATTALAVMIAVGFACDPTGPAAITPVEVEPSELGLNCRS